MTREQKPDEQLTPPPDLGPCAELPAHIVATQHPQQWADSGLPDNLADLQEPLELVWAAMQLAADGADQHTLVRTLGLTEDTALRLIIATTEQLLEPPPPEPTPTADN